MTAGASGRDLSKWYSSDHVTLGCEAGCIIQARARHGAPARRIARRHVAATGHAVTIVWARWQRVTAPLSAAVR